MKVQKNKIKIISSYTYITCIHTSNTKLNFEMIFKLGHIICNMYHNSIM